MPDDRVCLVESPQGPAMNSLCDRVRQQADKRDGIDAFPRALLRTCAKAGVPRWFLPEQLNGWDWSEADRIQGYVRLAAADLTTTFVLTQAMGACRRIAQSENHRVRDHWLPRLVSGDSLATVGISHLTTSRQHFSQPVLSAVPVSDGFELSGVAPWVTAGVHADVLVLGATLPDGDQILVALSTDQPGIEVGPGVPLVALSASCTDQVRLDRVKIDQESVLAGPRQAILGGGTAGGAGGLQTSALALGLAESAIGYLEEQSGQRVELKTYAEPLRDEADALLSKMLLAASGESQETTSHLRAEANRLVLRSTQAAMTAAKGAGFVEGHVVGRWCREALFFLVWSCPNPVSQAHLCELAGISD